MLKTLRNEAVNRPNPEPGSVVSTGCVLVPTPPNFKGSLYFLSGNDTFEIKIAVR
jgi:hypothetical protein